jgi:hypothetical protein
MSFSNEDRARFQNHKGLTSINNAVLFFYDNMTVSGKVKRITSDYVSLLSGNKFKFNRIKDQKIYNFYTGEELIFNCDEFTFT